MKIQFNERRKQLLQEVFVPVFLAFTAGVAYGENKLWLGSIGLVLAAASLLNFVLDY